MAEPILGTVTGFGYCNYIGNSPNPTEVALALPEARWLPPGVAGI